MVETGEPPPALVRVGAGGVVRSIVDDLRCRPTLDRALGGIRILQLHAGPLDWTDGGLRNDVIALNLGGDFACEGAVDGAPWDTVHVPRNAVAWIPRLLGHQVRTKAATEWLLIELRPEFVAAALGAAAESARTPLPPLPDSFSAHVMLALADEARQGSASAAERVEALARALVTHLAERALQARGPAAREGALRSPQLRRVLDYVTFHLDAPLTLQRLAELAQMDVFRFVRAFKQSTGLSPHRYVLEARIERAKELLRDRALSITEVALQTGFATPSHFSVTFRRLTHQTPRAYRDGQP